MGSRYVRWLSIAVLLCGCAPGKDGALAVTGQIEGVTIHAGSRVGGRVAEVLVDEGDRVEPGAVLAQLECDEAQALLDGAQAKLDQAEASLAKLEAGAREEERLRAKAAVDQADAAHRMALEGARSQEIGVAQANVDNAEAGLQNAKAELRRIQSLFAGNVVSQQVLDKTQHAFEAAEAARQAAVEQRDLLVAGTRNEQIDMAKAAYDSALATQLELSNGSRVEDIAAARAARDIAKAEVARAESNLREMTVTAPVAGVIESVDVEPGDVVGPGPLLSLVDPEDLELYVYVSALALGHIATGQHVPLTTDAHGDERFDGVIEFVATGGEFTPRNLQTEEERVQQMFAVKIGLDSAGGKLRAGMTAIAHFDNVPGY